MNLLYVVSFLSQDQIETVINIISDKVEAQNDGTVEEEETTLEACDDSEEMEADNVTLADDENTAGFGSDESDEAKTENPQKLMENLKEEKPDDIVNCDDPAQDQDEGSLPSYLQIIQKHYEDTNSRKKDQTENETDVNEERGQQNDPRRQVHRHLRKKKTVQNVMLWFQGGIWEST